MEKISVLDVGIGNIASVKRMIEKVGGSPKTVSNEEELSRSAKLIFPGVGSFDEGIKRIDSLGLRNALLNLMNVKKIPVLGICLGMQLLCRRSEEGTEQGLGVIDADVKRFSNINFETLKIPHMGWNTVNIERDNPLVPFAEHERRFYFVHSYYVKPDNQNIVIATSDYGTSFCAAFQNNNLFGVQFHPEKSHKFGLNLFKNFIELSVND